MMAGLSAMVKSPSCSTGIFWRGLMRVNSGVLVSPVRGRMGCAT